MQKGFEIIPHNRNYLISFKLLLVLLPMKQGLVLEERGSKENLVKTSGSGCGKVIFALPNEVVVVHVGLILIHVRCSGFEKSLSGLVKVSWCRSP